MSTMHLPGVYIRRLPEISHQPNVLLPSTTAMQTKDAIVFEVAQYNCVWDHCHRKSQGKWAWESRCPTSQLITSQKLHLHILTSTAFVFQHLLTLGRIWREMFFPDFQSGRNLCFSRGDFICLEISVAPHFSFSLCSLKIPRAPWFSVWNSPGISATVPSPMLTLRSCHAKYGFLGTLGSSNSACDILCIPPVVMKQPFVKSSSTWSAIGLRVQGTVRYFQNDFNLGRQRGSSCPLFISLWNSQKRVAPG